jgi:hypothetical protein
MRALLVPALWIVTAIISLLAGLGIGLEWAASCLVPLQKFLSKQLEDSA